MATLPALERPKRGITPPRLRPRLGLRALQAAGVLAVLLVPEHPGSPASFDLASVPLHGVAPNGSAIVPVVSDEASAPAGLPLDPAAPFTPRYGDAASAGRAEACLAEAIYYEGALEPEAGQRAIAQVVLNRVRHPAYPDSVCGVVFEGQQRATGCQFTFTCDGSRARRPVPALWTRAEKVAKAALGGHVEKAVGLSTHYHADYVSPRWSATLDRSGQVGRHIFYRWRGRAGRPDAFSASYAGREPAISDYTARPLPEAGSDAPQTLAQGLEVPADGTDARPLPSSAPPARFRARPLKLVTPEDGGR